MTAQKLVDIIHKELGCRNFITKKFINIVLEGIRLFDDKQSDYGCGNIAKFGEIGVVVRLYDKIERMVNLFGKNPKNEAVEDTWIDVGNYGFIGLMCRRGLWDGAKQFSIKEIVSKDSNRVSKKG